MARPWYRCVSEMGRDVRQIQVAGYAIGGQDATYVAGEGESTRIEVIVKRPYTEDVAGAEESPLALVPDGEREVTEKVTCTVSAPFLVGTQN